MEAILVDPLVPNRYYQTCSGNVYAITLPLQHEESANEDDELPELPKADIHHILQSGNQAKTTQKNLIYSEHTHFI